MTARHYYPEDVIKSEDGKRFTPGAYTVVGDCYITLVSALPATLTPEEIRQIDELWFRLWEGARLRERDAKMREFYDKRYPEYAAERDAARAAAEAIAEVWGEKETRLN